MAEWLNCLISSTPRRFSAPGIYRVNLDGSSVFQSPLHTKRLFFYLVFFLFSLLTKSPEAETYRQMKCFCGSNSTATATRCPCVVVRAGCCEILILIISDLIKKCHKSGLFFTESHKSRQSIADIFYLSVQWMVVAIRPDEWRAGWNIAGRKSRVKFWTILICPG